MSSRPDSTSTRIGLVLDGRFVLERAIGQGGAGTLWVATDQQGGGRVAVKLLHKTLRGSPDAIARIAREARVLIRLDHPNVARAIAIEVEGPRPYLAMELVPGVDLLEAMHDRVDRRAVFTAAEVDRIAADVGGALQRAHDAQVVHRDVKPANLRLRPDGSCVVLDFGIARVEEVARDLATTAGRTIGTYTYMSPEQARGSPEIAGASDQFSLAVVLFEVLTLRRLWVRAESGAPLPMDQAPPAGGNDVMSLLDRIVAGPRPRIESIVPAYAPLDEIFVRALAPKPSTRFESIAAFVAAFRATLATCDAPRPATPVPGRGSTEARPSSNEGPAAARLPNARPWMATTTSNAVTAPGRPPRDGARTAPFAIGPGQGPGPGPGTGTDSPQEDVAPTRAVPFEADEPISNTVTRPSAPPPRRRAWSGVVLATVILAVAATAGWVAFRLAEPPEESPPPRTPSARPAPP
ncbi:MAG: protein kinase, partial [Deltaproteobacteria bacterium]